MVENENIRRCSVCKIPNFERNNYYYGKLMTVRDYEAEQCYFNEKRWLINRMVSGWGVVCGLDVERKPIVEHGKFIGYSNEEVIITPGLAIDCCGREILVCENQPVRLIPEEFECRNQQDKETDEKLVICLEYDECETELTNKGRMGCDQKDKYEFNRIRESFKIRVKYKSDVTLDAHERTCPAEQKIEYLFEWDKLPSDDNAFKEFLLQRYDVNWIIYKKFDIGDDELTISQGNNSLSLKLYKDKNEVTLTINTDLVDTFIVKEEISEDGEKIYKIYKTETVHNYLCKTLKKDCTKCSECPCLILAEINVSPLEKEKLPRDLFKIDTCSRRELVYNNPLLYDLIDCYHGDLPRIIDINWPHDKDIDWDTFIGLMDPNEGTGFEITFDKNVRGVNKRTFILIVKIFREEGRFFQDLFIPGDVKLQNKKAVFTVEENWYNDMMTGSFIHRGAGFKIVLRSDYILDDGTNRALDGNFIGGIFPSGNGTQGGDFVSWFYAEANPKPPSPPGYKHKK